MAQVACRFLAGLSIGDSAGTPPPAWAHRGPHRFGDAIWDAAASPGREGSVRTEAILDWRPSIGARVRSALTQRVETEDHFLGIGVKGVVA